MSENVIKQNLYSIYDCVALSYSPPFPADSEAVAIRQYAILLNPMPKHIHDDYALMRLGSWDHKSGGIQMLLEPELIIQGDGAPKQDAAV